MNKTLLEIIDLTNEVNILQDMEWDEKGIPIGLWCNGSTTDFDSVCLGSNPGNPTKIKK